jgi:hypothetical protein
VHRCGTPGVVEHQHVRDKGRGGGTYTDTAGCSAVERELVSEDWDDCACSERGEGGGGCILGGAEVHRRGTPAFGSSKGSAASTRKPGWVTARKELIRAAVNLKRAHLSSERGAARSGAWCMRRAAEASSEGDFLSHVRRRRGRGRGGAWASSFVLLWCCTLTS